MLSQVFCSHCGMQQEVAEGERAAGVCTACQTPLAAAGLAEQLAGLAQRLTAVEQRLDRLEPGREHGRRRAEPQPAPLRAMTPIDAPPIPPPPIPPRPRQRVADIPFALPVADSLFTFQAPVHAPPAAPAKRGDLEQTIGLKWAGWIGAIVLVVGIGLGIKFAYDQGWLRFLSPQARLAMMSLAGFALIAAGEYVYRRINRVSAAALFGAGVATLFVVSYAGNVYYDPPVFSQEVAFVLAALTTLVGAAIAMRGRLVAIAILAHIGGNLAPFILSTGQAPGVPFYSYLYMLQLVALFLALWGHAPEWWALRTLALATTSFWVILSLLGGAGSHGLHDELLWFSLLYAFTFQGELLRSALRIGHSVGDAELRPTAKTELSGGAVFSTFVTAGITALVLHVLDGYADSIRGGWVLGLAALSLAGGFLLPAREGVSVQALVLAYRVQGVALVLLSVPVLLSGVWISLAWMLISLVFGVLAARLGRGDARVAGVVTWWLALIAWLGETATAAANARGQEIWLTILDEPIHAATALAWLLALAGLALAWLLHRDSEPEGGNAVRPWTLVGMIISVVASLLFAGAALAELPPFGATFVLMLWAWLLAAGDLLPNRLGFSLHALIVLLVATLKWLLIDALLRRLSPSWSPLDHLPLWNPLLGLGVLLAASIALLAWRRRATLEQSLRGLEIGGTLFTYLMSIAVAVVLTFGLSLEVDRSVELAAVQGVDFSWPVMQFKGLCWTMLWTLAVAALAWATWANRQLDLAQPLPWILLVLLAAKFLLMDTLGPRLAGPVPALVLCNLQALTGLVVAGGFIALRRLSSADRLSNDDKQLVGHVTMGFCTLIAVWIATLETDRLIEWALARGTAFAWPAWQLKSMCLTIVWTLMVLAAARLGRRFAIASQLACIAVLLLGVKFLLLDTVLPRLAGSEPVPCVVLLNFQALAGLIVIAAFATLRFTSPLTQQPSEPAPNWSTLAGVASVLIGLWIGTLEIDRAFSSAWADGLGDAHLAKLVAISIYWSLYALAAVVAGFVLRLAWLRCFGLGLFGITLLKVGVFDLSQVKHGYRILSSVGLGLLLLGTSVLYGKLSPVLLGEEQGETAEEAESAAAADRARA